jgi:uncharacterized protein
MSKANLVFDTNTLISAAIIENSVSGQALDKEIQSGVLVFSEATITELEEVLYRKKFDKYISFSDRDLFMAFLNKTSLSILPTLSITACRDPKDNKFLEPAAAAQAACLITGDADLLVLHPFQNIPIIQPSRFLETF